MSDDVAEIIERLFAEFERHHPLPHIVTVVRQARRQLDGEPVHALPELVERLARERLSVPTPAAAT